MLSFNIGPSKIAPHTYGFMQEAMDARVCEISHRSAAFDAISTRCQNALRTLLQVPEDYHILYTSSAHAGWDLAINAVKSKIHHISMGAFGEKWHAASVAWGRETSHEQAPWGHAPDLSQSIIPSDAELVCITENETSTGGMLRPQDIKTLRKRLPQRTLLAVDSTSIFPCSEANISDADAWIMSVQKGFGLPAGLGIMIVNDSFIEKSQVTNHLCGPQNMWNMQKKNPQTICTPNIFGIYILMKNAEMWNKNGGKKTLLSEMKEKQKYIHNMIKNTDIERFCKDIKHASPTTICMTSSAEKIEEIHQNAQNHHISLGKGYGALKSTTLRIGNFPAHTMQDVEKLSVIFT